MHPAPVYAPTAPGPWWSHLHCQVLVAIAPGAHVAPASGEALKPLGGANAVATIVVARWEGALDRDRLRAALAAKPHEPEDFDD